MTSGSHSEGGRYIILGWREWEGEGKEEFERIDKHVQVSNWGPVDALSKGS